MEEIVDSGVFNVLSVGESKVVGNYVFTVCKDDDGRWLSVSSVACDWRLSWRDDTLMFGVLLNLLGAVNAVDYLHCLCTLFYVSTSYAHDLVRLSKDGIMPFMDGVVRLVSEQNAYELFLRKSVSAEEDDRILADTVEMENLREDLNRIFGDDDEEAVSVQ